MSSLQVSHDEPTFSQLFAKCPLLVLKTINRYSFYYRMEADPVFYWTNLRYFGGLLERENSRCSPSMYHCGFRMEMKHNYSLVSSRRLNIYEMKAIVEARLTEFDIHSKYHGYLTSLNHTKLRMDMIYDIASWMVCTTKKREEERWRLEIKIEEDCPGPYERRWKIRRRAKWGTYAPNPIFYVGEGSWGKYFRRNVDIVLD